MGKKGAQSEEMGVSGKTEKHPSDYGQHFMTRFTADKIDENKFINLLEKRCTKSEVNFEKGKNGQLHYQIIYKTNGWKSKIKEREFWIKHFPELKFPNMDYLEPAKSADACYNYCCKEDNTFIRHVFSKNNDTKKNTAIYIDPFVEYKYEFYDWQKKIDNILSNKICPRTIYNFYGKYNAGKTDFCKHMSMKYGTHLLEGEKRHILDEVSKVYKDVNSYFWSFAGDESPNREFYQTVEKVKDMYFTSHFGTCKDKRMVIGNRPHVIIMSNKKLDLSRCEIDHDRFVFEEII